MSFKALVVTKNDEGVTSCSVQTLDESQLPEGNVTVAVDYSALNYKDGLCLGTGGGLVRNYPHIPGIDFAGTVEESADPRYQQGDKVIATGWHMGETHWGGYSQKARVNADWLVSLPANITTQQTMAIGTAGFTAMLAIQALENHGLEPSQGEVLVTGAAGGVGSVATMLLSSLGYEVACVTGRPDTTDFLRSLGATKIIAREELNTTVKRPLESATWAGCIDTVGGAMLARILGQMRYGASVAAVGLAGGTHLPATVIPFLLRSVNLLGIDSVMQPTNNRISAWDKIASIIDIVKLNTITRLVELNDLPQLGQDILKGQVRGRIVVDVNKGL